MPNLPITSSLPQDLIQQLQVFSITTKVPKNQVIEKALRIYLEEQKRQAFVTSFQRAAKDQEMHELSEAGLAEFSTQIRHFPPAETADTPLP